MTVDHKENKSSDEYRITIIDTIGPMIAELLKESRRIPKNQRNQNYVEEVNELTDTSSPIDSKNDLVTKGIPST